MKKILLSAILLFGSFAVADMSATKDVTDTTKDFVGTYNLIAKRESGNSFCFEDINISNVATK